MASQKINKNGWVLYEGPSQLDSQPIVCIVTGATNFTSNRKTGFMLQTWIMRSDTHPQEALLKGKDVSVCGNCPLRPNQQGRRVCYVNPMSLGQVYKQFKAGRYDGKPILNYNLPARIGSYGDPTAVPLEVWQPFLKQVSFATGYTRQWLTPKFAEYKTFCMASTFSKEEAARAQLLGWKTYRIRSPQEQINPEEISCPAYVNPGEVTCSSCKLCNGQSANISIPVHGINKTQFVTCLESLKPNYRREATVSEPALLLS